MKKVIILKATGGELANQLWNYASIYAYCLERGSTLENQAFYEYGNYFTIPTSSLFLKLFFFRPFSNYTKRKSSFKRRLWRKFYEMYVEIIISTHKDAILISDNKENTPIYLPPTKETSRLPEIERTHSPIYLDGWLFRNPLGLEKYRKEIREHLKPRQDIEKAIEIQEQNLRKQFARVVGVHVRQGDYKTWRDGIYFISQTRVREVLNEYLRENNLDAAATCFVITSDGFIDEKIFNDLNIFVSKENSVHDLFLLSKTDIVIGSNSTFGAFASYYGNIPFVVMQKEPIDWEYYKEKRSYFENKYSTFVHY